MPRYQVGERVRVTLPPSGRIYTGYVTGIDTQATIGQDGETVWESRYRLSCTHGSTWPEEWLQPYVKQPAREAPPDPTQGTLEF